MPWGCRSGLGRSERSRVSDLRIRDLTVTGSSSGYVGSAALELAADRWSRTDPVRCGAGSLRLQENTAWAEAPHGAQLPGHAVRHRRSDSACPMRYRVGVAKAGATGSVGFAAVASVGA